MVHWRRPNVPRASTHAGFTWNKPGTMACLPSHRGAELQRFRVMSRDAEPTTSGRPRVTNCSEVFLRGAGALSGAGSVAAGDVGRAAIVVDAVDDLVADRGVELAVVVVRRDRRRR